MRPLRYCGLCETRRLGRDAAVSEDGGPGLRRYARRHPVETSPMSFRANAADIRSAWLASTGGLIGNELQLDLFAFAYAKVVP